MLWAAHLIRSLFAGVVLRGVDFKNIVHNKDPGVGPSSSIVGLLSSVFPLLTRSGQGSLSSLEIELGELIHTDLVLLHQALARPSFSCMGPQWASEDPEIMPDFYNVLCLATTEHDKRVKS